MYSNNQFNFGVTVDAQLFKNGEDKLIKTIAVEIQQEENENASFVGTGIASGGRIMSVYTFDDVSDVVPYEHELKIEDKMWQITAKQKAFMQKPRRYNIRKTKVQYILTLE